MSEHKNIHREPEDDPLYIDALPLLPDTKCVMPIPPELVHFPGFYALPDITESTYEMLAGQTSFAQMVPESAFVYYVAVLAYARLLKTLYISGEPITHEETDFIRKVYCRRFQPPTIISLYLKGFGNTTLETGQEMRIRAKRRQYLKSTADGSVGWFGQVGPNTHYLYAAYPCLAVYLRRIQFDLQYTNNEELSSAWDLPDDMVPNDIKRGMPTRSLLGYREARKLTTHQAEWLSRCGVSDDNDDLNANPAIPFISGLMSGIQMILNGSKVKLEPLPDGEEGSLVQAVTTTQFEPNVPQHDSKKLQFEATYASRIDGTLVVMAKTMRYMQQFKEDSNWSIYDWGGLSNVPSNWTSTCNTLYDSTTTKIKDYSFRTHSFIPDIETSRLMSILDTWETSCRENKPGTHRGNRGEKRELNPQHKHQKTFRPPRKQIEARSETSKTSFFTTTTSTSAKDDPLYMDALLPWSDTRCVMPIPPELVHFPGFYALPDITESTYEMLAKRTSFSKRVPASAFAYYVAVLAYARLLKTLSLSWEPITKEETDFIQQVYCGFFKPPTIISLYLKGFGNTTLETGQEMRIRAKRRQYLKSTADGSVGWFGQVGPNTHYLYAAYPCLAVYLRRIQFDLQYTNNEELSSAWDLPDDMVPNDIKRGMPTRSLLGYREARKLTTHQAEWLSRCGVSDDNDDLNANPAIPFISGLMSGIQMILNGSKVKLEPLPDGKEGSLVQAVTTVLSDSRVSVIYADRINEKLVAMAKIMRYMQQFKEDSDWSIYDWGGLSNVPSDWTSTCNTLYDSTTTKIKNYSFWSVPSSFVYLLLTL
ncbi:uncharacterized protein LOC143174139 isoform X2 [Nomia melanderi]|uniref:uncharacterized protein LOC143174139 isoform X2 n=1 Tax=Nomia melanderi TaxID=2448451 RepID=UPI003FCDF147